MGRGVGVGVKAHTSGRHRGKNPHHACPEEHQAGHDGDCTGQSPGLTPDGRLRSGRIRRITFACQANRVHTEMKGSNRRRGSTGQLVYGKPSNALFNGPGPQPPDELPDGFPEGISGDALRAEGKTAVSGEHPEHRGNTSHGKAQG
jgi:hypothetical protein